MKHIFVQELAQPEVIQLWYDDRSIDHWDTREHCKAKILQSLLKAFPGYVIKKTEEHDSHGWVFGVVLWHRDAKKDWAIGC